SVSPRCPGCSATPVPNSREGEGERANLLRHRSEETLRLLGNRTKGEKNSPNRFPIYWDAHEMLGEREELIAYRVWREEINDPLLCGMPWVSRLTVFECPASSCGLPTWWGSVRESWPRPCPRCRANWFARGPRGCAHAQLLQGWLRVRRRSRPRVSGSSRRDRVPPHGSGSPRARSHAPARGCCRARDSF